MRSPIAGFDRPDATRSATRRARPRDPRARHGPPERSRPVRSGARQASRCTTAPHRSVRIGRCRSGVRRGARDRRTPSRQVARAPRRDKFGAAVAVARRAAASPRPARRDLRLVHRGVRHPRPQGGGRPPRRTPVARSSTESRRSPRTTAGCPRRRRRCRDRSPRRRRGRRCRRARRAGRRHHLPGSCSPGSCR